jgi:hypothetical protein
MADFNLNAEQWQCDFRKAVDIAESWACAHTDFPLLPSGVASVYLQDQDCITRVYAILRIDETLRGFFSNPENQRHFVCQTIDDGYFKGRRPIDLMGTTSGLVGVRDALDGNFRGGLW